MYIDSTTPPGYSPYSIVVVRQSCKLKVPGSIPGGGKVHKQIAFFWPFYTFMTMVVM
jgi:hypothetical protein